MDRYFYSILVMVLGLGFAILPAHAAVNKKANQKQIGQFITQGAFKGGKVGKGFSIVNIKRVLSPSKTSERMIVELGDTKGNMYSGTPGYFHAQVKQNPPRITIDFSQMNKSLIDSKKFAMIFKNSSLVKKTRVNTDSEDGTTNLTLFLKKPVKARVYSLAPKGKASKVVLDFVQIK